MYPYAQPQNGNGAVPQAAWGLPDGAGQPPPGPPPPQQQQLPPQQGFQQPLRLSRFPGDALHSAAPTATPMYAPPAAPLSRSGSAGGRKAAGLQQGAPAPPGPGVYMTQPMQPFQPVMPGSVFQPWMMGHMPPPPMPGMAPPPFMLMQPGPNGPQRSGAATPKSLAGSGATTPMHPVQRTLSGSQLLVQPALFQPPSLGQLQSGTALPASLIPGSGYSLPGSRVQSATHQAPHARGASYGSLRMEPMAAATQLASHNRRVGSATSTAANSLRGSMDLGSPAGRSAGERGGSAGHNMPLAGLGSSKPVSAVGSRAGSAGRKAGHASASTAPPVPDELDNIKVAVRVRPPNAQELDRGDAQAVFVNSDDFRQVQLSVPASHSRNGAMAARNFTFHACLGPSNDQQDVLRLCGITQLLDAALDGYNASILVYGQTGSGKTYTMSGREEALVQDGYTGDSDDDGIITRSISYLYSQLAARAASDGGSCRYALRASALEIYNEAIYDLVKFDKKQMQVRWDASKGFHTPDLACRECATLEDMLKLLSVAARHRRVGSHELNRESSRSHSLFTVYVDCTPQRPDDHDYGITRYGKVTFVDLAGSERLRDSKSAGETLKETTNINRSLFMLGKVIAALADGAQGARVPYRESKLTKLLMDSLGGSALALLIACCSPSAAHVEETLSTLSYAARAKNIRNHPAVQVDPEQAALSALKRQVKLLRSENAYLRDQLLQASLPKGPPVLSPSSTASRLPSRDGQPPLTAAGAGQLLSAAYFPSASTGTAGAAGVPVAGVADSLGYDGTTAAQLGPAQGSSMAAGGGAISLAPATIPAGIPTAAAAAPSPEELMRRLLETQRMLVQLSKENDRLAGENGRLRAGRMLVATDYSGALEELDGLRSKLETLEATILSASLDSNMLAALKKAGAEAAGSDVQLADASGSPVGSCGLPEGSPLLAVVASLEGVQLVSASTAVPCTDCVPGQDGQVGTPSASMQHTGGLQCAELAAEQASEQASEQHAAQADAEAVSDQISSTPASPAGQVPESTDTVQYPAIYEASADAGIDASEPAAEVAAEVAADLAAEVAAEAAAEGAFGEDGSQQQTDAAVEAGGAGETEAMSPAGEDGAMPDALGLLTAELEQVQQADAEDSPEAPEQHGCLADHPIHAEPGQQSAAPQLTPSCSSGLADAAAAPNVAVAAAEGAPATSEGWADGRLAPAGRPVPEAGVTATVALLTGQGLSAKASVLLEAAGPKAVGAFEVDRASDLEGAQ